MQNISYSIKGGEYREKSQWTSANVKNCVFSKNSLSAKFALIE